MGRGLRIETELTVEDFRRLIRNESDGRVRQRLMGDSGDTILINASCLTRSRRGPPGRRPTFICFRGGASRSRCSRRNGVLPCPRRTHAYSALALAARRRGANLKGTTL